MESPRTPSLEMPPEFDERARPLAVGRKPVFSGQSHRPSGGRRLNEDRWLVGRAQAESCEPAQLSEIGGARRKATGGLSNSLRNAISRSLAGEASMARIGFDVHSGARWKRVARRARSKLLWWPAARAKS